jgi:hypothetical protein
MGQMPPWGPVLAVSYGYFLHVSLNQKAEIQKLLKPNVEGWEALSHSDWLAQCLRDADAIQDGMTRKQIEAVVYEDNGKYVFKKSPYLRMDIEFKRHLATSISELDTVARVSKPYLEWAKH